jgi:HlyD family secretion protein
VQQVRYANQTVQNVVTYTTVVNVENPEQKLRPGMTATVSIIVGEAKNALRVPNAALRFTPNLSPEEMKKIMEESMPGRGQGQGPGGQPQGAQPQGGQPQAAGTQVQAAPGAAAAGATTAGAAAPGGQRAFQMGGRSAGGMRRQMPSRVWIQGADGKLKMVFIRSGLTDNTFTEILPGRVELKEGDEVLVGLDSALTGAARAAQMRGGGPMFIGR